MGDFHNISIRTLLAAIGLLIALPAFADAPQSATSELVEAPGVEAPGSLLPGITQPATLHVAWSADGSDVVPLTRAASQQYVDNMSPVGWLASYGVVVVGQSE